jgi:hypothetical protein
MRHLGFTFFAICSMAACGDDGADPTGDTESAGSGPTDPTVGAESSTGDAPGTTTGDDPDTTTGGEPSTGEATEDSTGASADCYAPVSECSRGAFDPFECGGTPVCDTLEVNDPSLNEFDEEPFGFVNPEAATCILEGLRDRTAGTYRIEVEPGQQYSRQFDLEVLSDGSVITHRGILDDKCFDEYGAWEPLLEAAAFQACLDSADETMMLQCMTAPGDATMCIESPTVCP